MIDHLNGKDILTLFVETEGGVGRKDFETGLKDTFKARIGITAVIKPVGVGDLPRSEKKSTRIFDNRY